MRIEFTAYDGDNLVHDLPGIVEPCNQTGADEERESGTAAETMMTEDVEDEYLHIIELPDEVLTEQFHPVRLQLLNWVGRVMDGALFVSGDDDYFDYYPGNIDALRGIAEHLDDGFKERADEAIQYAYDVRYYDLEPETIIRDEEELEQREERRDKELSAAAAQFREKYWNWRIRKYKEG